MRLMEQSSRIREFYIEYSKYLDKYIGGKESIYAVERLCELLIQSIIDFAAMTLSIEKERKPNTYRELLSRLADKLKINEESRNFLINLAGFRNILVHSYANIDREIEERSFIEIKNKLREIVNIIEEYAQRDPCLDSIKEKLKKVFEEYYSDKIEYVVVYGSIARYGCGRDIDLALKFKKKIRSALELGEIIVRIAEALDINEELVDIVDIDRVPPGLLKSIIDHYVPVYGDEKRIREDLRRKYMLLLDYWETLRYVEKRMLAKKTSSH